MQKFWTFIGELPANDLDLAYHFFLSPFKGSIFFLLLVTIRFFSCVNSLNEFKFDLFLPLTLCPTGPSFLVCKFWLTYKMFFVFAATLPTLCMLLPTINQLRYYKILSRLQYMRSPMCIAHNLSCLIAPRHLDTPVCHFLYRLTPAKL